MGVFLYIQGIFWKGRYALLSAAAISVGVHLFYWHVLKKPDTDKAPLAISGLIFLVAFAYILM